MDGIRERIAKLLALSESPNENEAKAALRKARKLMAQHKLTSADVMINSDEQVREVFTTIGCTNNRDPWAVDLANIIASNHCCRAVLNTAHRASTHFIKFWGIGDDPEAVAAIFQYAYKCVGIWKKSFKRQNPHLSAWGLRPHFDGYGYGFAAGVKAMYREQNREHEEFGLMVVVPKVVQDAVEKLKSIDVCPKEQPSEAARRAGYQDGLAFSPHTKLPDGLREGGLQRA